MKLTENFLLQEFYCKDGTDIPAELIDNVQELADSLQSLREYLGESIFINSAYRHREYNQSIGGSSRSQHLLAKASDIDPEMMLNVLQHGAAGSWQMVNRTKTAMNNDFDLGFAIDWMRKDLAICFDEAESLGIDLPTAKQVDAKYADLQKRGYSRADTSVLLKQFDDESR